MGVFRSELVVTVVFRFLDSRVYKESDYIYSGLGYLLVLFRCRDIVFRGVFVFFVSDI